MGAERKEGNFLTRALGIEAYQEIRDAELGVSWRKPSLANARVSGGLSVFLHVVIPLSETFTRQDETVTNWRLYGSIVADLASNVTAYALAHVDILAGIGFKMAVNLGVEAVPAVLRAVKRKFIPLPASSGLDY